MFQSVGMTLPSSGMQACHQVRLATLGVTVRTLPSVSSTTMVLECGVAGMRGLQPVVGRVVMEVVLGLDA